MYEKPAKLGNWLHRGSTLASLILTVVFFVRMGWSNMGIPRQVLFLLWIAAMGYGTVKILVDLISGAHRREQNFAAMLGRWEAARGGSRQALSTFWAVGIGTALVKLALPLLLYFL